MVEKNHYSGSWSGGLKGVGTDWPGRSMRELSGGDSNVLYIDRSLGYHELLSMMLVVDSG